MNIPAQTVEEERDRCISLARAVAIELRARQKDSKKYGDHAGSAAYQDSAVGVETMILYMQDQYGRPA